VSRMARLLLTGPCRTCGAVLTDEYTREQNERLVQVGPRDLRDSHARPDGTDGCLGSALVMAEWPTEEVQRRCAAGHWTSAVVPAGWMPSEPFGPAGQRCLVGGCTAILDFSEGIVPTSIVCAFVCSRCGGESTARVRLGGPIEHVLCMVPGCRFEDETRPPSFTLADVGDGILRRRCDVCFTTWEAPLDVPILECPNATCHARWSPADLPFPPEPNETD